MENLNFYLEKKKNIIILSIFFVIFFIGIFVTSDYGVSNDEYQERHTGFVTVKYVGDIFAPQLTKNLQGEKIYPDINDYKQSVYGVLFNSPLAVLEIILNIDDKKNQFLLRHYAIFLIFFVGLIFFYKIINLRFNNWKLALVGILFLFLSPRIFANSFYNNRDILLMSFFIISAFFNFQYLNNQNYKNAILSGFFTALAIDTRIVGVGILLANISIVSISNLLSKNFIKKIKFLLIYILFTFIFTYILWPYLWENPFKNFLESFAALANWFINLENLYFGTIVNAKNLPWHYIPGWISISTPIIYLFLFCVGLFAFLYNLKKINLKSANKEFIYQLYFFGIIFSSLIIVIVLKSTLYNGWRHMYFVYPFIILFAIEGINFFINKKNIKKFKILLYFFIFVQLVALGNWMIKNHPYQYVYFNSFIKKEDLTKKFDLDYWGLSYKQSFEYLLKNDQSNKIKVCNLSKPYNKAYYHLFSFEENVRNRIEVVNYIKDADYLITNYHNDKTIYDENFFKKFKIFYMIKVDNTPINVIFKKI